MRTVIMSGQGLLPVEAAKNLKARGEEIIVLAFTEQQAADFTGITDNIHVMSIGQVGKILKFLKDVKADSLVFAGKINKVILEHNLKLDLKALWMLARLKDRQEDTIMHAIVEAIEKLGITIRSQLDALSHLVVHKNVFTKTKPTKSQLADVAFGYEKARGVAGLDIGQSIIVKNKTVMAIESIEGTDRTIARGSEFANGNFTFVKVAKPHQDLRFDLPVAGMDTLSSFVRHGGKVFAIEADYALVINLDECIDYADKNGVVFMAYKP